MELESSLAPIPLTPLLVETKIVAAFVGSTRIRLTLRPLKVLVVKVPVHTAGLQVKVICGLIGPTSVAARVGVVDSVDTDAEEAVG